MSSRQSPTIHRPLAVTTMALLIGMGAIPPVVHDARAAEGNVTASLTEGHLEITGDKESNRVDIWLIGNDSYITVRGVEDTTVNGTNKPLPFAIDDVNRVTIRMGRGNDNVSLRNWSDTQPLVFPGSLTVDLGHGRDGFSMLANSAATPIAFGGDVRINGGQNNDFIQLQVFQVGGNVLIDTGNNGKFDSESTELTSGDIYGDLVVLAGQGDDTVGVFRVAVGGLLGMALGNGDDRLLLFDVAAAGAVLSGDQGDDLLQGASMLLTGVPPIIEGFETVNP